MGCKVDLSNTVICIDFIDNFQVQCPAKGLLLAEKMCFKGCLQNVSVLHSFTTDTTNTLKTSNVLGNHERKAMILNPELSAVKQI